MEDYPSKEWLAKYEQIKGKLKPHSKLDEYFTKDKIFGKNIHILNIGSVNFPTGNIIVVDPLMYLERDSKPFFTKVPIGVFPLTIAVVEVEQDHYRYAAVKVDFNGNKVDYFVEALRGNENFEDFKEGDFFGFNVDAGLGTIADVKTKEAYCDFVEEWEKKNPNKEIYDDLLAKEFENSYKKNPKYQRKDGDWINYKIPQTNLTIPMFQSGFGDGTYPVYFGYDKDNNICQAIIEFIDIELAFAD
jgi:hypothetical protein